jgi:hypothetical protein
MAKCMVRLYVLLGLALALAAGSAPAHFEFHIIFKCISCLVIE